MNRKKVVVIGAGITGLSAAWHLQRRGIPCVVFEKEAEAGGLCRSHHSGGFTFDYCGHLLHFRHSYAFNLIHGFLNGNLKEHTRNSWIHYRGLYVRYPFQANLYGLPPAIVKECLLGFIQASAKKIHCRQEKDFFTWIRETFGRGISRHFMVPYNEKFWTVHPRHLTCEWLNPFIPVPSLSQLVEGTVQESSRQFGYNARFWYPAKGGIGILPRAFCSEIPDIVTGSGVTGIDLKRKELLLSTGTRQRYDLCINTAPLPDIARFIAEAPSGVRSCFRKLHWNSIFNLNLGVQRHGPADNHHWIYFPQKEISFFRSGYFTSFSPSLAPEGMFSLYAEAAYSRRRPLDRRTIVRRMIDDLRRVGILKKGDRIVAEETNDIAYGYPVYDGAYRASREEIIDFLARHGILCAGRYGAWKYFSMEDSLLDGKRAAEAATAPG
jgi:protoporphyrinogen oxidase